MAGGVHRLQRKRYAIGVEFIQTGTLGEWSLGWNVKVKWASLFSQVERWYVSGHLGI